MSDLVKLWRSQTQAVKITGVPQRTISNWINAGEIQVSATKVDVIEIFRRDVARKKEEIERINKKIDSSENPQVRLTLAQCEKLETETALKKLELAEKEGKVLLVEDVERDLAAILYTTRSKILSLPSLAPQLADLSDPRAIADLLKRFADQILEELRFEYLAEDGGADAVKTAE